MAIFFILWGLLTFDESQSYIGNLVIIFAGILLIPSIISKLHLEIWNRITIKRSKFILWYSITTFILLFFWFAVSGNNTPNEEIIDNKELIEEVIENITENIIEKKNQEVVWIEQKSNDKVEWYIERLPVEESSMLYRVSKVIDWDTVYIMKDGEEIKLRLIWIDTPENTTLRFWYKECYWDESSYYLNELLNWKEIEIEYDKSQGDKDKYGRHLVYIFYNGKNINNQLIREGYGFEYTYNKEYKYSSLFKQSEIDAKNQWKGIWSIDTCSGNRIMKTEVNESISQHVTVENKTIVKESIIEEENIVLESNSVIECIIKWNISSKTKEKIYHYPGCKSYNQTRISTDNGERWFCSEEEARNAWWRVAGNCN
jgi:micrococcal nuclease